MTIMPDGTRAMVVTEPQMREVVRRLHQVYLVRGHHSWAYWRTSEDADGALLDILLDYDDDDVLGTAWVDVYHWHDRPEILPAGSQVRFALADVVGVDEVADALGIHPESVRRLIREGRLNARKLGNKWLVSRAYLAGYAGTYRSETGNRPLGQPAAWEVEHA